MLSLLGLVSVDGELTVTNNSRLVGFNSNNPNAPAFVGLLSTGAITITNNPTLLTIRGFYGLISCTRCDGLVVRRTIPLSLSRSRSISHSFHFRPQGTGTSFCRDWLAIQHVFAAHPRAITQQPFRSRQQRGHLSQCWP